MHLEPPSTMQRLVIPSQSWRIFRLANGWGAMVFHPDSEEPFLSERVDSQEAGDGSTDSVDSIANLLYSQRGEAPQAVLRSCETRRESVARPTKVVREL